MRVMYLGYAVDGTKDGAKTERRKGWTVSERDELMHSVKKARVNEAGGFRALASMLVSVYPRQWGQSRSLLLRNGLNSPWAPLRSFTCGLLLTRIHPDLFSRFSQVAPFQSLL